jgi:hypothetical protein
VTKADYIRLAAAFMLPACGWDVDRAIGYAERLWTRLSERGISTADRRGEPAARPSVDYCGRMDAPQAALFARFWSAYGHKQGRQRACLRWAQIAPDAALAESIIAAAKAQRIVDQQHPERVRKFAEGWLSERRWEDHEAPVAEHADNERLGRLRALQTEARGLASLLAARPSPDLESQLAAIREQIRTINDGA